MKAITDSEKAYLLKNAKNLRTVTLDELSSSTQALDPYAYYIVEKATEEEIRGFLKQNGLTLFSVYWVKEGAE